MYQYDGVNFEKSNVYSITLNRNDIILSFRTVCLGKDVIRGSKIILDFNKIKNLEIIEEEKNK